MRRISALLLLFVATLAYAETRWVGTWATSPVSGNPKINETLKLGEAETTVRQVVHISQGGSTMRLTLTNEFGSAPLNISSVHVAFLSAGSRILPATDHALTFAGQGSATIPTGQFLSSDPVKLTLPIFSDLVISIVVPAQALTTLTYHPLAVETTYFAAGDHASDEDLENPRTNTSWYFLKDVQVNAEKKSAAIVTLGDSITDGTASTVDANRRWPDVLAARLASNKKTKNLAILNEGISGNRILHEGTGTRALSRLDRDVLSAPGIRFLVLLEGINDIGRTVQPLRPGDEVTAEAIINGMKEIVMRARARNIRVIGATLTPFIGAKYASPAGEAMRQQVNAFIRTPGSFDGVIDFDKATQDPAHPDQFLPKYDHGDHLHPSDVGYAAMGTFVDLKLFK
jgi:lysophospholipase L1-like esterase